MTRPRLTVAALAISLLVAGAAAAQVATAADSEEVRQVCASDFQKVCPNATPGNGSLKACAKAHFMSFSRPCKTTLRAVKARMSQNKSQTATNSAQ